MRGEPFQLMCTVTANPAVAQKQWLTEDGNVVSTSFFGNGVLDDTKLKCRAENSLGVTEETVQITVHCELCFIFHTHGLLLLVACFISLHASPVKQNFSRSWNIMCYELDLI